MSGRIAENRRRTVDEIVRVALDVMGETGAAGLSLGAIAKRMGMRTPSLYGYFDSKAALCDEIFARGWRDLAETMRPHYLVPARPSLAPQILTAGMRALVGWALDHRAFAELMFWRPIAGWEPSEPAYAEARALTDMLASWIVRMQDAGLLRDDVEVEELAEVLMILSTGVITQQLANEPGASVEHGRFSSRIDALAETYLTRYGGEP